MKATMIIDNDLRKCSICKEVKKEPEYWILCKNNQDRDIIAICSECKTKIDKTISLGKRELGKDEDGVL